MVGEVQDGLDEGKINKGDNMIERMIKLGEGTLGIVAKTGKVSDGVAEYFVASPRLKKLVKNFRRDKTVTGRWVAIGDVIVWFKKVNKVK